MREGERGRERREGVVAVGGGGEWCKFKKEYCKKDYTF